jgi:DNA-binding FrmR family transcriptional regulator
MTADIKKQVLNNLNRVEGQIRGIKRLVEEDAYCIDVITQAQAAKSAISSVEDSLLRQHLLTCAVSQVKQNNAEKW